MLNSGLMYKELIQKAEEASHKAYCKYSRFAVGTALLTDSGEIYTGCNIENSSYPVGICAERVAFGKAISEGHKKFRAIAVCGFFLGELDPVFCPPCGMCRQFMSEFCEDDFEVILSDKMKGIRYYKLGTLVPVRFDFQI